MVMQLANTRLLLKICYIQYLKLQSCLTKHLLVLLYAKISKRIQKKLFGFYKHGNYNLKNAKEL
jgi:hypothetical protein